MNKIVNPVMLLLIGLSFSCKKEMDEMNATGSEFSEPVASGSTDVHTRPQIQFL